MSNIHKNLASGSWQNLSLCEQMGNIGSEVGRTLRARDEESRKNAFERAIELFDLTVEDPNRKHQLKEILRARELFVAAEQGEDIYKTSLNDLDKYFMEFAIAARS